MSIPFVQKEPVTFHCISRKPVLHHSHKNSIMKGTPKIQTTLDRHRLVSLLHAACCKKQTMLTPSTLHYLIKDFPNAMDVLVA